MFTAGSYLVAFHPYEGVSAFVSGLASLFTGSNSQSQSYLIVSQSYIKCSQLYTNELPSEIPSLIANVQFVHAVLKL